MLAGPGPLPEGPGWAYELMWQGVRALLDVGPDVPDGLCVTGVDGADLTAAYPELQEFRGAVADILLDGAVVAFCDDRPSPAALARRIGVQDSVRAAELAHATPVTYLAFDVLRLYGVDLRARPYVERRSTLERLDLSGPYWTVPPVFDDGAATLGAAGQHGLGGVVAKRLDAPYRDGERAPEWVAVRLPAPHAEPVQGSRRAAPTWRPAGRTGLATLPESPRER